MLIDEPGDRVIEVIQRMTTSMNPSREVREAAEVRPRRVGRI